MIGFQITGIDSLIKKLDRLGEKKIYEDLLKQVGEQSITYAKMYAPEMTGEMMHAIDGWIVGEEFFLVCNVEWAAYNEYGTIYHPAGDVQSPVADISTSGKYCLRPFMRPAAYRAVDEAPEMFSKIFQEIFYE